MFKLEDINYRANTADEMIYRDICLNNEYKIPDKLDSKYIIIDVGAHIGIFSLFCYERGSRNIFAYEALKENYFLARDNVADTQIYLIRAAIWGSEYCPEELPIVNFSESDDTFNTGGGSVLIDKGTEMVPTIQLDHILNSFDYVDLLKLDCEGAEFPILLGSSLLHKIKRIVGEFHEYGGEFDNKKIPEFAQINGCDKFTISMLEKDLVNKGFKFEFSRPLGCDRGIFSATI